MSKQMTKPNLTTVIGAALVGSLALGNAQATGNPFGLQELSGGYMQIAMEEGRCGSDKASAEAKCGGDKTKERSCGGDKIKEGSCHGKSTLEPNILIVD